MFVPPEVRDYDNLQQEAPKLLELTSTPDENLILDRYIRKDLHEPMMEFVIGAYDKWIYAELPQQIAARPIEFTMPNNRKKMLLARVIIESVKDPTFEVRGRECDLTPHVAELEERNYLARVIGKVEVYDPSNPTVIIESSEPGRLFDFPAMTKSRVCPISKLRTVDEYLRLQADPRDCFGYFIINGIRRSIPLVERLRHHIIVISPMNPRAKETDIPFIHAKQTVPTAYSTSQSTVMLEPFEKSDLYTARFTIAAFKIKIEARKSHIPNSVNVIMMCYLISYLLDESKKTEEDKKRIRDLFIREFKQMIPPPWRKKCLLEFQGTVTEYDGTHLETVLDKLTEILTPETRDVETRLKSILTEDIFPNIRAKAPAIGKIRTIIMIAARVIQYKAGFIQATSKNNWAYKNLDTAAKLCGRSVKKHWGECVRSIMSDTTQGKYGVYQPLVSNAKDLHQKIVNFDMTNLILNDFKNGQDVREAAKAAMSGSKPQGKKKMDMTMVLNTVNVIELYSLMTKIVTNMSSKNSLLSVRAVQGSYYNYICATTATDNEMCGITKFLAMSTTVTTDEPAELVINAIMLPEPTTKRVICRSDYDEKIGYTIPVSINGSMIGYTTKSGYQSIINLRRAGRIHRHTGVIETSHGFLEIYTDAGRILRPVLIVDRATGRLRLYQYANWKTMSFLDLLSNGIIEYLDSYEGENKNIVVATTFTDLENYHIDLATTKQKIENLDSEIAILKNQEGSESDMKSKLKLFDKLVQQYNNKLAYPPTHANIHPVSQYGITLAMSIYANHCQSCRMSFNDKMFKQANGSIHANQYSHTEGRTLLYTTNPTVESIVTEMYNLKGVAGGQTITLAFIADAMNQEDAIIFNRTLIDAGGFRYKRTKRFRVTLKPGQKFGRTTDSAGKYHMRHINEKGMPEVGAVLNTKDCVIGMYEEKEGVDQTTIQIDKSEYVEHDEIGTVVDVVTYYSSKKGEAGGGPEVGLTVSVRVDMYMKPQIGDKYTSRFAQKVTISTIRNEEDMPHFVNLPMRGKAVDAIVHPASIPTRMTAGYLMEPLTGRAYASKGRAYDATAHSEYNEEAIKKILIENGYKDNGKELLRNPDGKIFMAEIFTGPVFFQQLYHIAQEKINARAVGQVNKRTRQALASKNNGREKGQKTGEHERNALLKAGAAFFVQERFSTTSDAYRVVLCTQCSNFAKYEPMASSGNRFSCPMCGHVKEKAETCESTFGKIMLPYTFLYMNTLLMSMGIQLSASVTTADRYLEDLEDGRLRLKIPNPVARNTFLENDRQHDDTDDEFEPDFLDESPDNQGYDDDESLGEFDE
ncbi:DNA-directed RNA polymerase subunit RPB2 [uncultured virus]|nr:DNA-directed RNA polymerase subunit RPB2 [uncultured virus]